MYKDKHTFLWFFAGNMPESANLTVSFKQNFPPSKQEEMKMKQNVLLAKLSCL
jgi:hypothetical protein